MLGALVKFNPNGGSSVASQDVSRGGKVTKPANPTKTGYTFDKWCSDATLNNEYDFNTSVNSNMTLYAKWKVNQYNITLNTNGGTDGTALTGYTYGTGATLPADWVKNGYTFEGWYDNEQLTGYPITEISATTTGDKTFYAKWKANEYVVTLVTDGGAGGTNLTNYMYGAGAVLPTDWTKKGYEFEGWYDNAQFSGDPIIEISATTTGNKTFYAKWSKNIPPTPPTPPTLKETNTSTKSIKLTWTKVKGATSYKIYKATTKNGKYTAVGTSKGTSMTVKNLKAATTYYFKVTAVAPNGKLTSKVIKAKTKKEALKYWFKLRNVAGPIVKVTWTSQKGAVGYQVADNHSKGGKMKIQWTGSNSNNTYSNRTKSRTFSIVYEFSICI